MAEDAHNIVKITHMPQHPEIQTTLQHILSKLEKLDTIDNKLDNVNQRIEGLEERVASLENNQTEMAGAMNTIQEDTAGNITADVSHFTEALELAEKRLEILENSARRYNIRVVGWTPSSQGAELSKEVARLFNDQLNLNSNGHPIVVTRAFRLVNSAGQRNGAIGRGRAVVATLQLHGEETAEKLIRQANKQIRDREDGGQLKKDRVFIADDVCQTTREKRQKLMPRMSELRKKGFIALIPFSTPARLIFLENNKWHTEFYRKTTSD